MNLLILEKQKFNRGNILTLAVKHNIGLFVHEITQSLQLFQLFHIEIKTKTRLKSKKTVIF